MLSAMLIRKKLRLLQSQEKYVRKEIALPEVIFSIGSVALSDYATPTTEELPKSIEKIIKTTDAILLIKPWGTDSRQRCF